MIPPRVGSWHVLCTTPKLLGTSVFASALFAAGVGDSSYEFWDALVFLLEVATVLRSTPECLCTLLSRYT